MPIFKRRIFTRKVIYRCFQLKVGTFQKCKNAHACALRDCLGVSRPFVSDTSPKCIDREGLKRRRTETRRGKCYQPRPSAGLIALTSTWIIPDITRTSSNNCLLLFILRRCYPPRSPHFFPQYSTLFTNRFKNYHHFSSYHFASFVLFFSYGTSLFIVLFFS